MTRGLATTAVNMMPGPISAKTAGFRGWSPAFRRSGSDSA